MGASLDSGCKTPYIPPVITAHTRFDESYTYPKGGSTGKVCISVLLQVLYNEKNGGDGGGGGGGDRRDTRLKLSAR